MPAIFGTTGDDTLTGGVDDTVFGDAGNDTITMNGGGTAYGEAGDDIFIPVFNVDSGSRAPSELSGGSGYDTVDGANLVVPYFGSGTTYYIWSTNSATGELDLSLINSYRGFTSTVATVRTSSIERLMLGDRTTVALADLTRSIEIVAHASGSTMSGGLASDILRGGVGNDIISVGTSDRAYGGGGNDTFWLEWSAPPTVETLIDGGTGIDALEFVQTADRFNLVLGPNGFSIGQATFTSIEGVTVRSAAPGARTVNITGSDASETFRYIANSQEPDSRITFFGGGGDDTLTAITGVQNSYLDGGAGNDTLTGIGTMLGGAGDDVITGSGTLRGGTGNDQLTSNSGNLYGEEGDDILNVSATLPGLIDGGDGVDTLIVNPSSISVTIDLTAGTMTTSTTTVMLSGIENVIATPASGTGARVVIRGNMQNNALTGLGGDDLLVGMGGDDRLSGGAGVDTLQGGDGNDLLFGESGDDILNGDAGNDQLDGGIGNDQLFGGDGLDVLFGGAGTDRLEGGAGADILSGGGDADQLFGGSENDRLTGGAGGDTIDGGAGDDVAIFAVNRADVTIIREGSVFTVRGPEGLDTVMNVERLQFLDGIVDISPNGDLSALRVIAGTAMGERINGTSADDVVQGLAGNDVLFGGAGYDTLDGGVGVDTAIYSGVRRQYLASSTVVSGNGEGTDTLVSIEQAQFVDGVVSFDVDGIAAQIMRLYDATLDRQPDQAGLDVQIRAFATGATTLQGLANAFVASGEFQNRYGTLSNQQFVEQLYRFCLDREGDAAGIAVQVNALNTGTSRAALVVAFSESPEHRTLTQPILNAGLWVADEKALQIARLYDATLDRLPDAAGLAGQLAALNGGTSLLQLAANFVGSAEFQARYGALSNQQFVEQLYRFCLDREGDAPGIAAQVNALNSGTSRAQLVLAFSESFEHIALTAPLYSGGIRTSDPAFNAAPVQDESGKPIDDRPLVLVQADDALPVIKAENAQVLPGNDSYDPAQIVVGVKLIDDAFVLPPQDDLTPLVLPEADLLETVALEQVSLPSLSGDRMLTLPMSEDGTPDDATPWHRGTDTDGWMMQ